ncbi:MAG: hypothetical protein Q8Q95_00890 [bacterium]|nr:hypothetical protein [bacterium]
MNKNFFLTLTALAVIITIGYAAYTDGSVTDLGKVISSKVEGLTLASSDYLGAVLSTRRTATSTPRGAGFATSTTKAAGTRERNLPGTLKIIPINSKYLNTDASGVSILKFQITARKENDDIIKYIDFEIKGKGPYKEGYYSSGVYLDGAVRVFTDKNMTISSGPGGGLTRFVSMKKDRMVIRFDDSSSNYNGDLTIPAGQTRFYILSTRVIRDNINSPLSVRILKIAR